MTEHVTVKCKLECFWNDTLIEVDSNIKLEHKAYRVGTGWGNFLLVPKSTPVKELGGSYNLLSYQVFDDESLEQVDLKEFKNVDLFVKVPIPNDLSKKLEEVRENPDESVISMIYKLIEDIKQND